MRTRRPRRRSSGFSLLEVLIAAALLLLIAVGILPLFTRSIENNLLGNDALRESNAAADGAEDLNGVRFNADPITYETAAMDETGAWTYQTLGSSEWLTAAPSGETSQISRRTVLRQYQIQANGDVVAVAGNADRSQIHIKEVEMQVGNARRGRPIDRVAYRLNLRKAF